MSDSLRIRASWFEKPRTITILDDALVVSAAAESGAAGAGERPRSLALPDVVEVRLSHSPSRFDANRFRCRLRTRDGEKLTFHNAVWEGPVSEADISPDYRAFVSELCRRVFAANPSARFLRGRSRAAMLVENGILLALFVAMIAVFALLKTRVHWFQWLQIVLIVVYFPLAVMSYRRNRPGTFDPLEPPDEVLPK